jgi:DNA end-binding protein Ku
VREADFPILDQDVTVKPQELAMASSLVESLAGDFDPSGFEDRYRAALEEVIEQKVSSGRTQAVPQPEEVGEGGQQTGEVVDLLAALQRSVEKARAGRGEGAAEPAEEEATGTSGRKAPARSSRKKKADDEPAKPARSSRAKASGTGTAAAKKAEEPPEDKPARPRRKRAS